MSLQQSINERSDFAHIPAPAMLGMLGGGQLGRFFVIAAHELGYKVTVLDPDENSPAGQIADVHICSSFEDETALTKMAQTCAAISTEFENVPALTLKFLAQHTRVHPSAEAVSIAQYRVAEKTFFRDSGLPVGQFVVVENAKDLPQNGDIYPAVLKVARFGYDGKGQARVANHAEALVAFENFKRETCVLEKMLKLDCELSVVLARDEQGNIATFPTAENQHLNGILDISIVPARVSEALNTDAQELAKQLANKLNYVGVLGVEMFVVGGKLLLNEIAPRPHNSGHYTIDACVTNQFEQQVRIITGLPLGSVYQHSAAVMVNILGDSWFASNKTTGLEPAWLLALRLDNLKLHLYGKHEPRKARKMGHFTVIGQNMPALIKQALNARELLGVGQ